MPAMTRVESILASTMAVLTFIVVVTLVLRLLPKYLTILDSKARRSIVAGVAGGVLAVTVGELAARAMRWANS